MSFLIFSSEHLAAGTSLVLNQFFQERQQSRGPKGTKAQTKGKITPLTNNWEEDMTSEITTQQLSSEPSSVLCS